MGDFHPLADIEGSHILLMSLFAHSRNGIDPAHFESFFFDEAVEVG